MRLVVNVKTSQLRGVIEELGRGFPDMEIVVNIKEEELEKKRVDYQNLSTEQLQRLDKEMKERVKEKEEGEGEYPT